MFRTPAVGSVIRVTTRWQNINYFTYVANPTFDSIDEGTVIQSRYRYDEPDVFYMTTGRAEHRIAQISMRNVVRLVYLGPDGSEKEAEMDNEIVDTAPRRWTVSGSKGDTYTVTKVGKDYGCNCPGFRFNRSCRHVKEIMANPKRQSV